MAKVYAGVDSIRLSGSLGTGSSTNFRETTTVKFGTASFKPYGTGTGTGSLQRQGINYNQSSKDATRFYRQTGFFSGPDVPENTYAWDCWFYLTTSSAGNGSANTPSIFSWQAKDSTAGTIRQFELRVTGDDELTLVKMQGSSVVETVATINSATFSETNFLGAWWWVGFQKEVSTLSGSPSFHRKMWMGKSGTATQVVDSNVIDTYTSISTDQYRIGATGTGSGTPQFTPIDGFIDEVAIRKGNPFSGTVSCPTSAYTGDEEGMVDLWHFDTQSLNSAGSVNSADGTSTINGFFDFYLQTYNRNATNASFSESAGSILGDVTVETLDNVTYVSGVSASTSLGNLEPENQVIGVSLQTNTYNSIGPSTVVSSTVPFSGINSYDFTSATGDAVYVPNFGRECWGFNDFTLEAFVRGDGTTIQNNIFKLLYNEGGTIDEYGRNVYCGLNSSDQIYIENSFRSNTGLYRGVILIDIDTPDPSTWYHLAIVRKNSKIYVLWNGERVAYDIDSAGNGSFLNGGSITAIQGLGGFFGPFGGIDTSYPSQVTEFVLGSVTGAYPNLTGYIANFRSSYIAQYPVTQPTYNPPTGPFIGDESGTAYYAKTFSGSGNNNAGTAIPQAGINQTVVIQPEGITALNSVTVDANSIISVTGVSASTSLGNLVPDSEVVGVSLERHTGGGLGAVVGSSPPSASTDYPFTGGVRSYDVGNNSNNAYAVYTNNSLKNVYSFYNDFTVELFLKGTGTNYGGRFLGIQIERSNAAGTYENLSVRHDISGPAEQLVLYNEEDDTNTENDLVSTDISDSDASTWYHFALVRKNNKYSMFWDGKRVAYNIDSAGNGTVNGGGSINISSNDAYLFKPFGGNTPALQGLTRNVYFGLGLPLTATPSHAGFFANTRISYIAQYDPDISVLSVPTAPFDADASGQEQYNKGQTAGFDNFATTLPTTGGGDFNTTTSLGSVTAEVGQLAEANGSLLQTFQGTANLSVELDPIVPTGQNLTTALNSVGGGPGILAPTTGQNLTVSLGSINLPVSWSNVGTGTTSTWTPVNTGGTAVGP